MFPSSVHGNEIRMEGQPETTEASRAQVDTPALLGCMQGLFIIEASLCGGGAVSDHPQTTSALSGDPKADNKTNRLLECYSDKGAVDI